MKIPFSLKRFCLIFIAVQVASLVYYLFKHEPVRAVNMAGFILTALLWYYMSPSKSASKTKQ